MTYILLPLRAEERETTIASFTIIVRVISWMTFHGHFRRTEDVIVLSRRDITETVQHRTHLLGSKGSTGIGSIHSPCNLYS